MGVFCQIFINKPSRTAHRAGKPITGIVRYIIDEPTQYKDIILSLIGKGKCHWSERRNKRTRHFYGKEVYTEQYLSLHEKEPEDNITLPIGTFDKPFTFVLPHNIPSTFKDNICTIKYKLVLTFIKPNFFSINKKFSIEIDVIGNVKSITPEGILAEQLKKTLFTPLKKKKHHVDLQAEICNSIFKPGENVTVNFKLTNDTDVIIPSIRVKLVNYMKYRADGGRKKKQSKTISECVVETPSIPDNAIVNLSSTLQLRDFLCTIQHSRIMTSEYRLKVTLRLPMPYINTSLEIPIVIGLKYDGEEPVKYCLETEDCTEKPPSYFEVMNECKDDKEGGDDD